MPIIANASTRVLNPGVQQSGANSSKLSKDLNGVKNTSTINKSSAASNVNQNGLSEHILDYVKNITNQTKNSSNVQGRDQTKSSHVAEESKSTSNSNEECWQTFPSSLTFYAKKLNIAREDFRNDSSKNKSDVEKAFNRYDKDGDQSESARKRFEFFLIIRKEIKDGTPVSDTKSLKALDDLSNKFIKIIATDGLGPNSYAAGSMKSNGNGKAELKSFQKICNELSALSMGATGSNVTFNKEIAEVISTYAASFLPVELQKNDVIDKIFRPSYAQHQAMWDQTHQSNLDPFEAMQTRFGHEILALDLLKAYVKNGVDPVSPTANTEDPAEANTEDPAEAKTEGPPETSPSNSSQSPTIHINFAPVTNLNIFNNNTNPKDANKDATGGADSSGDPVSPPGNPPGRSGSRRSVGIAADPRGGDGVNGPATPGPSADKNNTAEQGSQTDRPTAGRSVPRNDAGTGTDNGATDGVDSSDDPASQPASPPGNRAGGRGRGNPPGRSGSRRSVGSDADPRGDDGVNGPATPGASADKNNTAEQGSQTDRPTAGRSVPRNDAGTGTDNGATGGADSSDDPASPPGNRAGGRGRGNPPGRSGSRRSVGSAADPRGGDGVNGPATPGASADKNNTAEQGSQTDRPTAGRSVPRNDAGTGTDNGATDGVDSSDDPASPPASPPGNRAGGRGRGNPPGRSGSRRSVGSDADPRDDDGVNGPATPGASADKNNTAGQGSQTDRPTAGRSVPRNDAGTGTDNGATDGADSSDDPASPPASPPGNRAGGRGRGNPPGRSGSRRSVGSDADPRGDDGVNGPATPGPSANKNNTAGQGSQTDRPTAGRSVPRNDAGTGTDNGATDGADSSDDPASQPASPPASQPASPPASPPGNRAGGRGRGNPPGRSGSRRSVGSDADPRGDDGVNGPATPGASADKNNTAEQGSQTDRPTAGRSVPRNDAGTGTDNGATGGADSSDDPASQPASPPGNRAGGRGRGNPPGRSGSRRSVGSAADPRGDDGVNGPATPGASADKNNTAEQGSQTDRPTAGRSVSRNDAGTGTDNGATRGADRSGGRVSPPGNRAGGRVRGFVGGVGSAQASSVLSGVSKDLLEQPGPHVPILNRFGTTFQGMRHSSSQPGNRTGSPVQSNPSDRSGSRRGVVSSAADPRGGDGVNGPATPGASADKNNTAGQGSQTDRPTSGRSVSRNDAGTGTDNGATGGANRSGGRVSPPGNRAGGRVRGFVGGVGSAQASSVLSGVSKDLLEQPGSHVPILNRFGTTFQGMRHSSSQPGNRAGSPVKSNPSGRSGSRRSVVSSAADPRGGDGVNGPATPGASADKNNTAGQGSQTDRPTSGRSVSRNDAGTGTDNGATGGADRSGGRVSQPGNRAGSPVQSNPSDRSGSRRSVVSSAADPRGGDGVNGPATPGASADKNNTAGQGSQTDRPTAGRSVSRNDAGTGTDNGATRGADRSGGRVSPPGNRTGGRVRGFVGGVGSAQASSVLSGVSKDLLEQPGPHVPILNRFGTTFQGTRHSSSQPGNRTGSPVQSNPSDRSGSRRSVVSSAADPRGGDGVNAPATPGASADKNNTAGQGSQTDRPTSGRSVSRNDAGTGTDNGATGGANSSGGRVSPPGNPAGSPVQSNPSDRSGSRRSVVSSAAVPRGGDGVNGPATPGASADKNNTAGQGSQTDRPTSGRSVSRNDAGTGTDNGATRGANSSGGRVSPPGNRTGGRVRGFVGGVGSAQASSVLSGVSKDLLEQPGPHVPSLNRFGTTFQGMRHSSFASAQGGLRQNGIPSGKAASKDGNGFDVVNRAGGSAGDNPVHDFVKGLRQPASPVKQVQSDRVNKKLDINPAAEVKINLDSSATGLDKWGKRTHLQQEIKGYIGSRGSSTAQPLFNGPSHFSKYK